MWGYCETDDAENYTAKYAELTQALLDCPLVQGYCYTQLTDVEQEQNGLHTYDRQPKLNPADVKNILMQTASVEKQA